jgi:prevent-host-death family protein
MQTVTLSEARAKFSKVIDDVTGGEEVVITRMGKPIARILHYGPGQARARLGFMMGRAWIAKDFDAWPDEEARALGCSWPRRRRTI